MDAWPRVRFETLTAPSRTLCARRQTELCDELFALNSALSPNPAFRANWGTRIRTMLQDTDLIVLAYEDEELVGHFSCRRLRVGEHEGVYIDTFSVHPRLHHTGVGTRMAIRLMAHVLRQLRGRSFMLGSRISSPSLATATRAAVGEPNYYPSFAPQLPDPRLTQVAVDFTHPLWPDKQFCAATGVLAGAYGGKFLPQKPTRDVAVQAHFERHLDAERGDALVQVCWFRARTWLTFASNMSTRTLGRHPRPQG
jgi:GNAT superfamily N-acetyltransferase